VFVAQHRTRTSRAAWEVYSTAAFAAEPTVSEENVFVATLQLGEVVDHAVGVASAWLDRSGKTA